MQGRSVKRPWVICGSSVKSVFLELSVEELEMIQDGISPVRPAVVSGTAGVIVVDAEAEQLAVKVLVDFGKEVGCAAVKGDVELSGFEF